MEYVIGAIAGLICGLIGGLIVAGKHKNALKLQQAELEAKIQAEQTRISKELSAESEAQLERKAEPRHVRAALPNQPCGSGRRAASRQHVVDDDDLVTGCQVILVDLQRVGSVFQGVLGRVRGIHR